MLMTAFDPQRLYIILLRILSITLNVYVWLGLQIVTYNPPALNHAYSKGDIGASARGYRLLGVSSNGG